MDASILYISIIIGTVLSLFFAEKVGVVPGGLIVPGYLALFFDQPAFLLVCLIFSLLTYLIVMHGVARFTLLYGRRKFVAMIVAAILLKFAMDFIYPIAPYDVLELSGIGVIVPALIANSIQKQGWAYSLGSTVLLSGMTFVVLSVVV